MIHWICIQYTDWSLDLGLKHESMHCNKSECLQNFDFVNHAA